MAGGVVDPLEVIQVAHQQGQRFARAPGPLEFSIEASLELAVVGDAGHRVGGRQLPRGLIGLGILDRDHRLVGQRLQDSRLAAHQPPSIPHVDHQDAGNLAVQRHGNAHCPLQADPARPAN